MHHVVKRMGNRQHYLEVDLRLRFCNYQTTILLERLWSIALGICTHSGKHALVRLGNDFKWKDFTKVFSWIELIALYRPLAQALQHQHWQIKSSWTSLCTQGPCQTGTCLVHLVLLVVYIKIQYRDAKNACKHYYGTFYYGIIMENCYKIIKRDRYCGYSSLLWNILHSAVQIHL